mmetsp:Transcript_30568/g.46910  ORF Transcript_30568/g.46910 Transcript_30568/m.46910 type:complete len:348 (+) Transcript_30568:205-1248(+)|eukprot:CAMPEP_0195282302 /NCGR_PEP_ID=MMETSP0707-20130614/1229_1 /TAXON_ID=33640 /ORGANISM="Asterionellopsis glacialis, Strain CCMP134" /LENGTH=347 /DNA_ID=CAMNT_0040341259 /DNA_START=120 /DNA_END=1163 /DNA_ORIENTATION=+
MTYDDIVSSIGVMRMQEERAYSTNYTGEDDDDCFVVKDDEDSDSDSDVITANGEHSSRTLSSVSVVIGLEQQHDQYEGLGWNERFAIVQWCYRVADAYTLKRETVAIAISFLDRFLATAVTSRDKLRLATMTCMNLATKLQEGGFHNGLYYNAHQVHEMELVISQALGWRLHPPTSLDFVRQFLDLHVLRMTSSKDFYDSNNIYLYLLDQAKYQTELALYDCDLVNVNPSSIAFAALWNAFDTLTNHCHCRRQKLQHQHEQASHLETIAKIAFLDQDSQEIQFSRTRLNSLLNSNNNLQDDSHHRRNQNKCMSSTMLLSQEKLKTGKLSVPTSLGESSPRSVASKQA